MSNLSGEDIPIGSEPGEKTEYFCTKCLQLRLSLTANKSFCHNCGSTEIIPGKVGELDKQALIEQYKSKVD